MKSSRLLLYNFYKVVVSMNRLRELRIAHGMTQADLAGELNVARTAISKYEIGQLDLSSSTILRLCDIFGCTADYPISWADPRWLPRS